MAPPESVEWNRMAPSIVLYRWNWPQTGVILWGMSAMGLIRVKFGVGDLLQKDPPLEMEGLVDTGSAYPFIPEDALVKAGIEPSGARNFVLADGTLRSFPTGNAIISYQGSRVACLVVFGPSGTEPLFGALALESLGLEVDPVNLRLRAVGAVHI